MSCSKRSSMHDLQDAKSEFWGIRCEAGKRYSQVVKRPFHLTMAALDPEVRGQSSYISLMVERGGRQYLLCNLKHDAILQVNLNLYFDKGEQICFSLKGDATVHLSGYHIDNGKKFTEEKTKMPVTMNDIDLDNSSDEDDPDFEEMLWDEEELESSDDDEDEDDEEDEDEEEDDEDENAQIKVEEKSVLGKKPKGSQKRQLDEDGSSDEDSSEESAVIEVIPATKLSKKEAKKLKMSSSSTPAQNNKVKNQKTPKKLFEDNLDFDGDFKSKKNPFIDDLNSSIGRTPMPKISVSFQSSAKETPGDNNLKNKSPVKKDKQSAEVDGKMNQSLEVDATSEQDTSMTSESKKKKKKKRKSKKKEGDVSAIGSATPNLNDSVAKKTPKSWKKLDGGVVFDDIKVGHGLEAKNGKVVHMFYTGKLDNGLVFDSTQPGSRPLSFKMGTDAVIKGLDIGMQGMKVGGKRLIRIPPAMGYKNQKMGKIPPSSTLNFMVELKAVS